MKNQKKICLLITFIMLLLLPGMLTAQSDTKTLRIYAPPSGDATDSILLWRSDSTVRKMTFTALGSALISANDGVFMNGDTVQLGGDLNKQTTINLNSSNLIFNTNSTGNVGIGTSTPTATLHVAGTGAITNTPTSTNPMDNYLVADSSGNIHSRLSVITHIGEERSLNATTDWSNANLTDIMDFYFIDKSHTITLPTSNTAFRGKLIRFYIYGGQGAKVIFNGVTYPRNYACPVPNFTYSGTAGTPGLGTLTITDATSSSATNANDGGRFRFVDILCDGKSWWVDNR